jgi:proton-translocating NAD(P)+ transhydrogenase subunit beta
MITIAQLAYLLAAVLFFLGLKNQAQVRNARRGNLLASAAMLIAIIATLIYIPAASGRPINWTLIIVGLVVGSSIGAYFARRVAMTSMPEMVALFNGSGGVASALVALAYLHQGLSMDATGTVSSQVGFGWDTTLGLMFSILIGGLTFSGSLVALGKLAGKVVPDQPVLFPGRHIVNAILFLAAVLLCVLLGFVVDVGPGSIALAWLLILVAFALGVMLVISIGGADMPVVISLLNSYSGLAAAMTGFAIKNSLLVIAGALVGAAGLILTRIMCKAMNRSLVNVLFGGFGAKAAGGSEGGEYTNVTSSSAEEAAMMLESAGRVIFVPGYGLAVAQAQHTIRDLANELEKRGVEVKYAIHPVAGRMPGHMNVLLAEADVPYQQLYELDDINPEFKNTDVVVVVGANDVVNPAAIKDEDSPIWGMPILTVHEARSVFIIKRSLSPGFAAIPNELFDHDNAFMLFGDAKKMLQEMITALREG